MSFVIFPHLEFAFLFFVLPTLFAFTRHRLPAIPSLWLLAGYSLFFLLRDTTFQRERLWGAAEIGKYAPGILLLFSICLIAGSGLVMRFAPQLFLSFPKSAPGLWALVMLLYPILSVYPQGVIYRAFIFHRYANLFPSPWLMIVASAGAFAYVHIVFRNILAVALTFGAGLLFAWRYWQTGSLFVSSFEHALYGCAIFTVGLGRSFYSGAVRR